jgi:ribonuclease P/MRP protein subunit POP5
MVRIKERYLLVNIIYPPQEVKDGDSTVPNLLVQHQPTIEHLTAGLLAKAIKEKVAILFGDYGAGAMEGTLSGMLSYHSALLEIRWLTCL